MVNNLHSAHPTGAEYLKAVLSSKVYDVAQVTPLQDMAKLSERLGNKVFIKREDRQPVHSFKLRGAYAMIAGLSAEQKASGVIAASAGNHAQGVALSAKHLGLRALIVMPQTPQVSKSMPCVDLVVKCYYMAPISMKPKPKRLNWRKAKI